MNIIKPKLACKNCKHLTGIMNSQTGRYYCKNRDKYVAEDDYCTHYNIDVIESETMTDNIVKLGDIDESNFEEYRKKPVIVKAYQTDEEMLIETLEGVMKANISDYIIIGVNGEIYPCKADIFHKTYEKVE